MMRKIFSFAGITVFLLFSIPSFAQAEYAPFEIFGGYNLVRAAVDGSLCPFDGTCKPGPIMGNMHGWNMALAGNINSMLGIKGEISGAYKSLGSATRSSYTFMIGPQINGRFESFPGTLFGHALFGVNRSGISVDDWNYSENFFEIALGGGIDWGKGRVSIRAPQIDYFPRHRDSIPHNNFRISTGIVFHFGK